MLILRVLILGELVPKILVFEMFVLSKIYIYILEVLASQIFMLEMLELRMLILAVFLSHVLISKMLISREFVLGVPTILVIEMLMSRLAMPGMLEVLMLSKTWKYTYNHLESWN